IRLAPALGQVAVLVQNSRQLLDAGVEAKSRQPPGGALDARLASSGEDLVHQLRALVADEVRALVGELPVALGPERLAGGSDAVAAARPARRAARVAVGHQAFAL